MISISNVTRKLDSFDNSNQIHLKNCNIRKLAKFFIAKQEKNMYNKELWLAKMCGTHFQFHELTQDIIRYSSVNFNVGKWRWKLYLC